MEGPILLLTKHIALSTLAWVLSLGVPKETEPRGWRS